MYFFASFKMNIPMKVLANSLLSPSKIPKDKLKPLPDPGGTLLKNPFYVPPKTKKKKGKKG